MFYSTLFTCAVFVRFMHGKWQAPKAFPLKPNYFFFPPCPSPAPNPATMEYQRFMTFQKNLFDIYIQRSACAPMPAPAPAPSRRLSIRCGSWLRSVPCSRYPVPGSRLGSGLVFISLAVPWGSGASNYLAWRLADRAQRQTDKAMVDGREASPLLCLYDFRIRLTYGREQ